LNRSDREKLEPFRIRTRCPRNGLIAVKAKAKKQTSRGRKQDRARVAGGRDHEVRYTAKKTNRSAGT
jgi:hypothetical protein